MMFKKFELLPTKYVSLLTIFAFSFAHNAQAKETNTSKSHVREITSTRELQQVLSTKQPTVLYFYAPWCGACKAMKEPFETVAQLFKAEVNFVKIDADNDSLKQTIDAFGVDAIPTLIIKHIGALTQEQLSATLLSLLPKNSNALKGTQQKETHHKEKMPKEKQKKQPQTKKADPKSAPKKGETTQKKKASSKTIQAKKKH